MRTKISPNLANMLLVALALVLLAAPALAADPGDPLPATSEAGDQKTGSILFFNLFTSSAITPHTQNTRFDITNANSSVMSFVHLFFVEGATCAATDQFICLTPNETMSMLASSLDPGVTGYMVAVAVDSNGCPVSHNFLIGDAYIKILSGHTAKLNAVAIAALYTGTLPGCDSASVTATLSFDATAYNRVPRVLALDSIPSLANSNQTLLVVNRVGGNLATGAASVGAIFGILYDDAEHPFSFTFTTNFCQFRAFLNNDFPRTAPRLNVVVPAGRTGWLRLFSLDDIGLLGAAINFNPNTATMRRAFTGGQNMHHLALATINTLIVPVMPPDC